MERITATQFCLTLDSNSSRPIVVADRAGRRYMAKPRAGGEGPQALLSEALASTLGAQLDLPVLPCKEIVIDEKILAQAPGDALHQAWDRSPGSNIGFEFREDCEPFSPNTHESIPPAQRRDLFLWDLAILNIDRTARDPNLLIHDGNIRAYGYGSCLRLVAQSPLQDGTLDGCLKRLRSHPFYETEIDPEPFLAKLSQIDMDTVDKIVDGLPDDWFRFGVDGMMRQIKEGLRLNIDTIISDTKWFWTALEKLHAIERESESVQRTPN